MTDLDDSELKRLSYTFHDEIRNDIGLQISIWGGLRSLPIDTDLVQFH